MPHLQIPSHKSPRIQPRSCKLVYCFENVMSLLRYQIIVLVCSVCNREAFSICEVLGFGKANTRSSCILRNGQLGSVDLRSSMHDDLTKRKRKRLISGYRKERGNWSARLQRRRTRMATRSFMNAVSVRNESSHPPWKMYTRLWFD